MQRIEANDGWATDDWQTSGNTGSTSSAGPLARGLGWLSLGLGLADLFAPRQVARMMGIRADPSASMMLRLAGVREIGTGAGILLSRRPTGWLWARVAGDAMDLALTTRALLAEPAATVSTASWMQAIPG